MIFILIISGGFYLYAVVTSLYAVTYLLYSVLSLLYAVFIQFCAVAFSLLCSACCIIGDVLRVLLRSRVFSRQNSGLPVTATN